MTSTVTMTTRMWRHYKSWQRSVTHSHEKYYVRYIPGGILFCVGEGLLVTPHPFLRENEQQCLVVFTFKQQVCPHDPDARSALFLVVPSYIIHETRQLTDTLVETNGAGAARRHDGRRG